MRASAAAALRRRSRRPATAKSMPTEIYISKVPTGVSVPGPVPIPSVGSSSPIADALSGLGNTLVAISRAAEATRATEATTDYLTRLDALSEQFTLDTDYSTAPRRFAEARSILEAELLSGRFSRDARATLQLSFRRSGLAAQGAIDQRSLARHVDATSAALNSQEQLYLNNYLSATSDVQRADIRDNFTAGVDNAAANGLIGAQDREIRLNRFDALIGEGELRALIRERPQLAIERLQDPANDPWLTPSERQQFINMATNGADDLALLGVVNRARLQPATATLETGILVDPNHAELIFDQYLIPAESSGYAGAVSDAGALGISQILPGTAREVARGLGMDDIANLTDAELGVALLEDPVLNRRLGFVYFQQHISRYEGNVVLALAAYNAGPARGDRWQAEATALFGANPSPAEILSVIDIDETRNYVAGIYQGAGASLDIALSPESRYRAANQVSDIIAADQAAAESMIRAIASAQRSGNEYVETLRQPGLRVADENLNAYLTVQRAAAATGDVAAAAEVRALEEAIAAKPSIEQAYAMPLAQLHAAIAEIRAELAAGGNVSGAAFRQLTAFEAVAEEIATAAAADPVALGERAGLYQPVPLDPAADFTDAGAQAMLTARDNQARYAAATYGAPLLPFKEAEAAELRTRWGEAGELERLSMLGGLAQSMSEEGYRAAVEQIAYGDPFGLVAGLIALDRPDVARDILRGAALLSVPGVEQPAAQFRRALHETMGGQLFPGNGEAEAAIADAALAYYVAQRGANRTLWDATDEQGLKDAIEAVAGDLVDRNSMRFPAPPGMDGGQVNRALDNLTDADLAAFGGALDVNGNPFDPRELGRRARLVPLEPFGSRYAVLMPSAGYEDGVPVLTQDGNPLVIDLRAVATGQAGRAAGEAAEIRRLQQEGLDAYLNGDLDRAREIARELLDRGVTDRTLGIPGLAPGGPAPQPEGPVLPNPPGPGDPGGPVMDPDLPAHDVLPPQPFGPVYPGPRDPVMDPDPPAHDTGVGVVPIADRGFATPDHFEGAAVVQLAPAGRLTDPSALFRQHQRLVDITQQNITELTLQTFDEVAQIFADLGWSNTAQDVVRYLARHHNMSEDAIGLVLMFLIEGGADAAGR